MNSKLMTIALAALVLAVFAAPALAGHDYDDWREAQEKYEKYLKKYHHELEEAREEYLDGDYDDYRKHRKRAAEYLEKATFYAKLAKRRPKVTYRIEYDHRDCRSGCDRRDRHENRWRTHDYERDRRSSGSRSRGRRGGVDIGVGSRRRARRRGIGFLGFSLRW